jgi:hypothetical protein
MPRWIWAAAAGLDQCGSRRKKGMSDLARPMDEDRLSSGWEIGLREKQAAWGDRDTAGNGEEDGLAVAQESGVWTLT